MTTLVFHVKPWARTEYKCVVVSMKMDRTDLFAQPLKNVAVTKKLFFLNWHCREHDNEVAYVVDWSERPDWVTDWVTVVPRRRIQRLTSRVCNPVALLLIQHRLTAWITEHSRDNTMYGCNLCIEFHWWLTFVYMLLSPQCALYSCPSNSIWPHLSYDLVRSKRGFCQICSVVVILCSFV